MKAASKPRLIRLTANEKKPWEMAEAMRPELLADKAGMMKSSVSCFIRDIFTLKLADVFTITRPGLFLELTRYRVRFGCRFFSYI